MTSVHDNEVISYEVNLKNKYIVINTEDREKTVKIKFSNVMAHLFEDQLYGSILLDIENYEIDQFINGNKDLFERHKPYCWPIYYESIEEFKELLIKEQYKCYVISSSYGFNGWVLAKEMSIDKGNA